MVIHRHVLLSIAGSKPNFDVFKRGDLRKFDVHPITSEAQSFLCLRFLDQYVLVSLLGATSELDKRVWVKRSESLDTLWEDLCTAINEVCCKNLNNLEQLIDWMKNKGQLCIDLGPILPLEQDVITLWRDKMSSVGNRVYWFAHMETYDYLTALENSRPIDKWEAHPFLLWDESKCTDFPQNVAGLHPFMIDVATKISVIHGTRLFSQDSSHLDICESLCGKEEFSAPLKRLWDELPKKYQDVLCQVLGDTRTPEDTKCIEALEKVGFIRSVEEDGATCYDGFSRLFSIYINHCFIQECNKANTSASKIRKLLFEYVGTRTQLTKGFLTPWVLAISIVTLLLLWISGRQEFEAPQAVFAVVNGVAWARFPDLYDFFVDKNGYTKSEFQKVDRIVAAILAFILAVITYFILIRPSGYNYVPPNNVPTSSSPYHCAECLRSGQSAQQLQL